MQAPECQKMFLQEIIFAIGLLVFRFTDGQTVCKDNDYFFHLADIHIDPFYNNTSEWSKNTCDLNVTTDHGVFGNYQCDAPWRLFLSSVDAMKQYGDEPAFILWTGDSMPHPKNRTWLSQDILLDLIQNITTVLTEAFEPDDDNDPTVPFFVALGNHDYFPGDQLPGEENEIYEAFYEMWEHWLQGSNANETDQIRKTFKKGAYYTRLVPGYQGIRMVILNTNLYYTSNKVATGDDPGGQFAWLETVLKKARTNNEKVHIGMHIPPGVFGLDDVRWLKQPYNARLDDVIRQNGDVIIGTYAAHEHLDGFRIFYEDDEPAASLLIAPSVTPWRGPPWIPNYLPLRNPAVRKICFDRQSHDLTDVQQLYLDLPKANEKGEAEWETLYTFQGAYDVEDVTAHSLHGLVEEFKLYGSEKFEEYNRVYTVGGVQIPSESECDCACKTQHVCAILNMKYSDFDECLESDVVPCTPSATEGPTETPSGGERPQMEKLLVFMWALMICLIHVKIQ